MKFSRFMLFAIAAMAAVSCMKDIEQESNGQMDDVQLVPMTFNAVAEGDELPTKALITSDGNVYSMQWSGDESISVLSASKTTAQEFTNQTTSGGKNAVFYGFAASDPTYYAVYPHNSGITLSESTITNVTIPATQTATAGTFDPKAYIAVAQSSTEEFSFKTVCAMVRFSLTDVEGVTKVTFSGNNDETLACKSNVVFKDGTPTHPWVSGVSSDASKVITLNGPFTAGTDYYLTLRAGSLTKGITLTVHTAEGPVKYITRSTPLSDIRNKVINLGNLDERTGDNAFKTGTPNDLYVAFMHGYSIEVTPGISYTKETYPVTPTLITNNTSNKTLGNGLYFVDPDVSELAFGTINQSVIVGRYENTRTPIGLSSKIVLSPTAEISDLFVLKNLKVTAPSSEIILGTRTGTFETVILNDCYLAAAKSKNIIWYNDATNSTHLSNIFVTKCDCKFDTSGDLVNIGSTANISSLTIGENVIFADDYMTGCHLLNAGKANVTSVDFSSNTLYKTVVGNNHFIHTDYISNFQCVGNFLVECNHSNTHKNISSKVPSTYTVSNNAYVKRTDVSTYLNVFNNSEDLNPKSKSAPVGMLTNWDPSNDTFGISGYYSDTESYGATR